MNLNLRRILSVHEAMSPMILPTRTALAALPAFCLLFSSPALAQITPPPAPPSPIRFADELAGRRLLFAASDAYRNAPALRFSARWTLRTQRAARTDTTTGVETVAVTPSTRRLVLTTETTAASGGKQIRRVIAGGATLLATHYQARRAGAAPTREFVRLPLAPGDTLAAALRQVRVSPRTRAAELLLGGRIRGTAWRGAPETISGAPMDVVWEIEPGETRRAVLDARTHLLRRFERWTSNATGNVRAVYQREDYDAGQTTAATLPAALFRQTVPPGYRETALPDAPPAAAAATPGMPGPAEADAESRRLLARWTRANDRLLTYSAQIEVSDRQEANPDPAARPLPENARNQDRLLYTVWLHKPGRARLTEETPAATGNTPRRGRRARSLLAVSDGRTLSVTDRLGGRTRTGALANPDRLAAELNRAGFGIEALQWLLAGPDLEADRAVYRGRQVLENGETVEVVELARTQVARPQNRRTTEVTRTTTVFLGADGLPRRIEERRSRDVVGVLARDQPGDQVTTIRYRETGVDEQPPHGTFDLLAAER